MGKACGELSGWHPPSLSTSFTPRHILSSECFTTVTQTPVAFSPLSREGQQKRDPPLKLYVLPVHTAPPALAPKGAGLQTTQPANIF